MRRVKLRKGWMANRGRPKKKKEGPEGGDPEHEANLGKYRGTKRLGRWGEKVRPGWGGQRGTTTVRRKKGERFTGKRGLKEGLCLVTNEGLEWVLGKGVKKGQKKKRKRGPVLKKGKRSVSDREPQDQQEGGGEEPTTH